MKVSRKETLGFVNTPSLPTTLRDLQLEKPALCTACVSTNTPVLKVRCSDRWLYSVYVYGDLFDGYAENCWLFDGYAVVGLAVMSRCRIFGLVYG